MFHTNEPFLFRRGDNVPVFDQGRRRIPHVGQAESQHRAAE
jgi:hypothetical protein